MINGQEGVKVKIIYSLVIKILILFAFLTYKTKCRKYHIKVITKKNQINFHYLITNIYIFKKKIMHFHSVIDKQY